MLILFPSRKRISSLRQVSRITPPRHHTETHLSRSLRYLSIILLAIAVTFGAAGGALSQAACNQLSLGNSVLSATPTSLPAGSTSSLSVTLRNNGGNTAACAGVWVRFTTTFGTLSTTANVLTNASGVAGVTLTSPIAGTASVSATIQSSSTTGAPGVGNPATVVFTAANQAPTANAGPDQTVASGASVALTGAGSSDPEGGTLSYAWTQTSGPAVTLTGATTVSPGFTAPTLAAGAPPAVLVFSLVVTDPLNASSAPDTVTITVNPPANQGPTANAGPDQTVASGASVALTGAGSTDPEGGTLSYAWTQTAGPAVTLTGATTVSPGFTAPTLAAGAPPAVLVFSLVVTDPLNASSAPDTVTITVNPPANQAPTANAGPDQSVASGASVALDRRRLDRSRGRHAQLCLDPDLRARRHPDRGDDRLPELHRAHPRRGRPAPPSSCSRSSSPTTLNASSAPDTVTITVNPPANQAPTANAGPDQSVASGASVVAHRRRLVRSRGRHAQLRLDPGPRDLPSRWPARRRRPELHRAGPRRGRFRRAASCSRSSSPTPRATPRPRTPSPSP